MVVCPQYGAERQYDPPSLLPFCRAVSVLDQSPEPPADPAKIEAAFL